MYANEDQLVRWLSSIPELPSSHNPVHILDNEDEDASHTGSSSFLVLEQSMAVENNDTPRANRFLSKQTQELGGLVADGGHNSPTLASSASNRSAWVSNGSIPVSNRSSPSKQFRSAEMQDAGFKVGNFRVDQHPESLKELRLQLRDIGSGHRILPASLQTEVCSSLLLLLFFPSRKQRAAVDMQRHATQLWDSESEIPAYAFDTDEATRATTEALATNLPSLSWVQGLVSRANECHADRECEASWNADVHSPILEQVFRSDRFSSRDLVDFRFCPSAQILPWFKPRDAPSKMVDFCIFIRPKLDSPEERAINSICQLRPGLSINHTDLGNFCKHPIALSIETKRPAEHGDKATLQMGTWHSSQWRSLRYNRNCSSPQSIEFLPGVIVQGHDWQFVATILDESGKARLLRTVRLGGTESELTVYSLVMALQRLRRWIKEVYWPAFVSDMLKDSLPG